MMPDLPNVGLERDIEQFIVSEFPFFGLANFERNYIALLCLSHITSSSCFCLPCFTGIFWKSCVSCRWFENLPNFSHPWHRLVVMPETLFIMQSDINSTVHLIWAPLVHAPPPLTRPPQMPFKRQHLSLIKLMWLNKFFIKSMIFREGSNVLPRGFYAHPLYPDWIGIWKC